MVVGVGRWLRADGSLEAKREEKLPFRLLESSTELLAGGAVRRACAGIDEGEWVPAGHAGGHQRVGWGQLRLQLTCLVCDVGKDVVFTHAAKPVLGIGKIAFAAVHDPMPKAARGRCDSLADRVGLFEKIVQQPNPRQTTPRHLEIGDRMMCEGRLQIPGGETLF